MAWTAGNVWTAKAGDRSRAETTAVNGAETVFLSHQTWMEESWSRNVHRQRQPVGLLVLNLFYTLASTPHHVDRELE